MMRVDDEEDDDKDDEDSDDDADEAGDDNDVDENDDSPYKNEVSNGKIGSYPRPFLRYLSKPQMIIYDGVMVWKDGMMCTTDMIVRCIWVIQSIYPW